MVVINPEKCIGCGACLEDCLQKAISLEGGTAVITKPCFECGHCLASCPMEAITLEGPEYGESDVEPCGDTNGLDEKALLHAFKARRSIRHFRKDAVKREDIEKLLNAARFAPTGGNAQNIRYIVVPSEKMDEFNALCMGEFRRVYADKELLLRVIQDPDKLNRLFLDDDDFLFKGARAAVITVCPRCDNASLASANMELMAATMGMGALYIGYFVRLALFSDRIREYLGLSEGETIQTCLVLGYHDMKFLRTVPRKKAKVQWLQ